MLWEHLGRVSGVRDLTMATSTGVKRSLYGFIENPGRLMMYAAALFAFAVYVYACVCEG